MLLTYKQHPLQDASTQRESTLLDSRTLGNLVSLSLFLVHLEEKYHSLTDFVQQKMLKPMKPLSVANHQMESCPRS